jgi:hypothetical protein
MQTPLEYSENGYIRLTFPQFCELTFPKRLVIEDDDLRRELIDQELPAFCAGYCDWLDDTCAVQISVGWAWFTTARDMVQVLAPGGVSSNVMFVSPDGRDLGTAQTSGLLQGWLATMAWQARVRINRLGEAEIERFSLH